MSVTPGDRRRLEAIVSDRSAAQKHAWRARIILATAAGCGTTEIMRRSGKSKPVVWRWQERFTGAHVSEVTAFWFNVAVARCRRHGRAAGELH